MRTILIWLTMTAAIAGMVLVAAAAIRRRRTGPGDFWRDLRSGLAGRPYVAHEPEVDAEPVDVSFADLFETASEEGSGYLDAGSLTAPVIAATERVSATVGSRTRR